MSIIGMISQYVTPAMLQQIAKKLGVQPAVVENAMGAAIPAILSGILGSTRSRSGADAFEAALGNQKAGGLEGLDALLERDTTDVTTGGRDMLGAILGGTRMDALKSGISSYSGTSGAATESLIGMAGTVIMGAFGKTANDNNLDSAQVLQRLGSERDEIAGVIPPEFADKLGASGLLDALSDKMDRVGTTTGAAAAPATSRSAAAATNKSVNQNAAKSSTAARTAAAHPVAARGSRPWWQWVLGVLILLGILWYLAGMFNRPEPEPAPEATAPAPAATTPDPVPAETETTETAEVGTALSETLASLTSTLGGITDAETAQTAVPDLTSLSDSLTDLQGRIATLPETAATELKTTVSGALPALQTTVDQLLGNSALGDILRPVLTGIMDSLRSIAA